MFQILTNQIMVHMIMQHKASNELGKDAPFLAMIPSMRQCIIISTMVSIIIITLVSTIISMIIVIVISMTIRMITSMIIV